MYLQQNKDGFLTVVFSPVEMSLLQLELDDMSTKYNEFMSDTNGEGDDSEFPFILTHFAQAYIGGILQFIDDLDELECSVEIFNEES